MAPVPPGPQVVPNPSSIFLSDRDLAPNVSSAVAGALARGREGGGKRAWGREGAAEGAARGALLAVVACCA